jgi:hypothetical protein
LFRFAASAGAKLRVSTTAGPATDMRADSVRQLFSIQAARMRAVATRKYSIEVVRLRYPCKKFSSVVRARTLQHGANAIDSAGHPEPL